LIVGSISGRIEPICSLSSSLVGHIYTLVVGDSYRLCGVGRLLVSVFEDYLVRYAADFGKVASALKLETTAQNVGARAFYERLGFTADDAPRSVYGYGASGIALVRPVSSPPTTACL
jgi:ribosomal protein S18 acetylase RimI-like enzyme